MELSEEQKQIEKFVNGNWIAKVDIQNKPVEIHLRITEKDLSIKINIESKEELIGLREWFEDYLVFLCTDDSKNRKYFVSKANENTLRFGKFENAGLVSPEWFYDFTRIK